MTPKESLELFLFSDEPARELTGDHLVLRPFSSMVAAAALTNRGPFNIGVFSGWGQGKTTVLRQAQALIEEQEKPNVITAWVNAWQYEHEDHPIVPLLAIIINEITKAIDDRKNTHEKEDDALTKTFKDLKRALRSIAYGFSAKAGASIPGFANLEIGFVAKDMIDRDEKLSSDRDPLLDQSLYYHAYDRLEKFREQLVKSQPADQPKIIVFIDDLDRCLPSKALHLLESLKLVLAQPGFIFVLGVDRHVIDSFLTKRYHREFGIRADKGHGKHYMDKIIQLPLDLPHHQNRFEDYIWKSVCNPLHEGKIPKAFVDLFGDGDTGLSFISALAAGCDRTPRTLIRTLNYLLTDLFLREKKFYNQEDDPFSNSAEFLQFAAVSRITRLTFGSEHERLYRRLIADDRACEQIAKHFDKTQHVEIDVPKKFQITSGSTPPAVLIQEPEHDRRKRAEQKRLLQAVKALDMLAKVDAPPLPEPYVKVIGASESLDELFRSALGQRWLKETAKRQAIEVYLAIREDSGQAPEENSEQIINAAIRKQLRLSASQGIGEKDREKIIELDLLGQQVCDLTTLKSLTNLQELYLAVTPVSDVSMLKSLTKLKVLYLSRAPISDVTALSCLTNLRTLVLEGTEVSDLSALKSLTNLQQLDIERTPVSDVTPLYGLKDCLTHLWLQGTPASKNTKAMSELYKALPNTLIHA